MACVFAGCAIKRPSYDVPDVVLPSKYRNEIATVQPTDAPRSDAAASEKTAISKEESLDVADWWRLFGNTELDQLVDRALANNPDIRIATLRIAQAKARADQAEAGRGPSLTAQALTAKQAPGGTVGSVPVGGDVHRSQRSYQASVRGEWRMDVWGELSALSESAEFQLWRAAFERDNVQRMLVASLASSYIEYIALNDRLNLARETENALGEMLAMIEKRVAAGDATLGELEQQRAAIFSLRATMPTLEQQRDEAINSIAFLVGAVPGSLSLSNLGLDSLATPSLDTGLPSALLLRRPDVRVMEARLLSADADIDVARARLFPTLDLSAQAGYSSTFLSKLITPQTLFWNMLASASASIFDGGRRAKEEAFSQAVHEELLETYIRTIHQALREVETGLVAVRLAEKRLDAQGEATRSARRAWEISLKVYAIGGIDYLGLLDAERTYHRYLDELQRMRMERYRGYINVFQALGAGGQTDMDLPGKAPRTRMARNGGPGNGSEQALAADIVWDETGTKMSPDIGAGAWWVELPAIYHRSTIAAAWRDLRVRYPALLEKRVLRPTLVGRIGGRDDGAEAWYRLYVAPFASAAAADEFCKALQGSLTRCRVVAGRAQ